MTLKEWYDDQHPLIQPVIKWTLIFMTIGWIIPMAALITHPSGDPHTDDDGDGYAAANATYYYNTTAYNITSTVEYEYEPGAFVPNPSDAPTKLPTCWMLRLSSSTARPISQPSAEASSRGGG